MSEYETLSYYLPNVVENRICEAAITYDNIYIDYHIQESIFMATFLTNALAITGNLQCSQATARYFCTAYFPRCMPSVEVPGSGGLEVTLREPLCRVMCEDFVWAPFSLSLASFAEIDFDLFQGESCAITLRDVFGVSEAELNSTIQCHPVRIYTKGLI